MKEQKTEEQKIEEIKVDESAEEGKTGKIQEKIARKNRLFRNRLGNLLMVVGVIIIAIPFVGRYLADRQQEKMLKDFYAQIEADLEEETEKLNTVLGYTDDQTLQSDLDASAKAIEEIALSEGLNTENIAKLSTGPTAIGIIDIPKISLKYPIAEGVDNTTLRFCIGHMPKTAELGEVGNSVLAGHRSHSFGSFFNRLDELVVGDAIIIRTKKESTSYTVFEKKRVHKTDLSVLAGNRSQKELTLITCELGINPEERIIVKARVEGEETSTAADKASEPAKEEVSGQ